MKRFLLFFSFFTLHCSLFISHAVAQRTASITVNATTKYQHIDGFGGTAMTPDWRDDYTQEKVNMLWGTGEGQIGLNIMRLRISPNENEWGGYGNPVRWARQVNPNMQVFATPWTPPKKYKTHNTTGYYNEFGTWVWPLVEHSWGGEGSNGGAINPECYDEFADFLERYRQTMEQKGCPIDIISIQNESDYTPTTTDDGGEHASYESCIYSPKEMAAMCKALKAKLDPKCKVMGPECFGWQQHVYNNTLANIQDAVDNIDIWGNHLYGTNDWSFVKSVTDKTGKHMWETEFLLDYNGENAPNYQGEFKPEYKMIESLENTMKAGYSAYVYYSMITHFFASNHGGSPNQLWKRAYVFSHYAKNATGKTRIGSSFYDAYSNLLGGSTYMSDNGDSIVVMMLNKATSATYTLTVKLPWVPKRITQVATNDVANAQHADITESSSNGTANPKVTLLPGTFYTFIFEKTVSDETTANQPAASAKQAENGNPLWSSQYMADPTSIEYNGRLYVYATNDQQEFDYHNGLQKNTYGHITQLACMSTDDMVNWTNHGIIDVKAIAPWIATSWAPSIVSREEADGKTHFYLYFTNTAAGIGVLTATSPTGPWTDPLGHALIDGNTPGLGTISNIIDPGVAINDNGTEAYLTFGGGDVTGTDLQPGNARVVKLGSDMISLDGDIKTISAPCHFEANELNYYGGRWVYSYCTRWSIASNWTDYTTGVAAPAAASMVYMLASDPLADKWSYRNEFFPNPGTLGYPYGNNHTHVQKFGTKYYVFYHTQWLENQKSITGGYRNLQVAPISVTINKLNRTVSFKLAAEQASMQGVEQLKNVNPFDEQSGDMAAIKEANWWMVRGVNFSADQKTAHSLIVRVKGCGRLEVKREKQTATPIAVVDFNADDEQTVAVDLAAVPTGVTDYLYFMLPESNAQAEVLSWQFSEQTAEEITSGIGATLMNSEGRIVNSDIYDLQGRKVEKPQRGLYIMDRRKIIIK